MRNLRQRLDIRHVEFWIPDRFGVDRLGLRGDSALHVRRVQVQSCSLHERRRLTASRSSRSDGLEFPPVAGHLMLVAPVRLAKLGPEIGLLPKHHAKVQYKQRGDEQDVRVGSLNLVGQVRWNLDLGKLLAARVRAALDQLPQIAEAKKAKDRDKARASTTDPDARVMKMGDGGFRPAFNVQLATTVDSQIITGVEVTNSGGDQGQLAPMIEQHKERYGKVPDNALVDGGFVKKEDIERVEQGGTTVYAPVPEPKDPERDAHTPCSDDKPEVAAWRKRMATAEAKAIYRQRAATAECVNALARNRGLQRLPVRGLQKVKAIALWYALVHNVMRAAALRAEAVRKVT